MDVKSDERNAAIPLAQGATMSNFVSFRLFGLRLDMVPVETIVAWFHSSIQSRQTRIVFGWSITIFPKLRSHPEIATFTETFDLVVPDGKGCYLLCALMGAKMPSHSSLPDLVDVFLRESATKGYSVYLLGASSDVNATAQIRITERFPGIGAVGGRDGFFTADQAEAVFEGIASAKPQLLLIGISSPKKEELANALRSRLQGTIIVPCGGMLDVLSGKTSREPRIFQRLALAWIYRFLQEPRRLFRPVLVNGLVFVFVVMPILLFKRFFSGHPDYSLLDFYDVSMRGGATQDPLLDKDAEALRD
jgi:N-acetylglucosaminyldiphosphoundecaprenol N-acetyl-beta-D-mannosaminyltransferase